MWRRFRKVLGQVRRWWRRRREPIRLELTVEDHITEAFEAIHEGLKGLEVRKPRGDRG